MNLTPLAWTEYSVLKYYFFILLRLPNNFAHNIVAFKKIYNDNLWVGIPRILLKRRYILIKDFKLISEILKPFFFVCVKIFNKEILSFNKNCFTLGLILLCQSFFTDKAKCSASYMIFGNGK